MLGRADCLGKSLNRETALTRDCHSLEVRIFVSAEAVFRVFQRVRRIFLQGKTVASCFMGPRDICPTYHLPSTS